MIMNKDENKYQLTDKWTEFEPYTDGITGELVRGRHKKVSMKLLQVPTNVLERSTGTKFRISTASWVDDKGVERNPAVIINEKNFQHGMDKGCSYMVRLMVIPKEFTRDKDKMVTFAIMSHFAQGEQMSEDWFDFGDSDFVFDALPDLEKEATKGKK